MTEEDLEFGYYIYNCFVRKTSLLAVSVLMFLFSCLYSAFVLGEAVLIMPLLSVFLWFVMALGLVDDGLDMHMMSFFINSVRTPYVAYFANISVWALVITLLVKCK